MSVLKRDMAAYQSAVDRYNRGLNQYNSNVSRYNQSLVTDENGNVLVRDTAGNVYSVDSTGKLGPGVAFDNGKTVADYGATAIEGDSRFQLLRQHPITAGVETVNNAQASYNDNGQITGYYIPNSEGGGQPLGAGWKVVSQNGPTSEGGTTTYTLQRDASAYMDKPAAYAGQVNVAKPDPSIAEVRRMITPGSAEQARGLIGEVIRGHGVTGGTPVMYRSGATGPKANQAVPTTTPPTVDPGFTPPAPAPAPTPAPGNYNPVSTPTNVSSTPYNPLTAPYTPPTMPTAPADLFTNAGAPSAPSFAGYDFGFGAGNGYGI